MLKLAIDEENILMVRWRKIGGDGSRIGIVLENLLDAQQRRTDAERDWVASQTAYLVSLVRLQRAMGTLLINEGISPQQDCALSVSFVREDAQQSQGEPVIAPPIEEEVMEFPLGDPLLNSNPLP